MNCKEFENKILGYLENELDHENKDAFLAHKQDCPHCSRALENTERMVKSLSDLKKIKAPEDLSESIIASLEKEVENRGTDFRQGLLSRMPRIKRVSLAAVLVLLITAGLILRTDWIPAPREDEMTVTESTVDEGAGITSMDDQEEALEEDAPGEEDYSDESPDMAVEREASEEKDGESQRTYGEETFGLNYSKWLVILTGIGVISVIVVFRRNRVS